MNRISYFLAALLVFTAPLMGQFVDDVSSAAFNTNTVKNVYFEGLITLDELSMRNRVHVETGKSLNPAVLSTKVSASVSALFETGFFDDVEAYYDFNQDKPTDLDVIFVVRELPSLDTVKLEGYSAMSKDDLTDLISLVPGRVYSRAQLERDRQKLLSHYRSNGYLTAEIGFNEKEGREGETSREVTFVIREGEKVVVHSINVKGNDNVLSDDIISSMETSTYKWYGSGEFKEDVFETDKDSVLMACKAQGFLDAKLKDYHIEFLPDSTFKFYMGRTVKNENALIPLLSQMNQELASAESPLAQLSHLSQMRNKHYYRHHRQRFSRKSQAVATQQFRNEEQMVKTLNDIIQDAELRALWLDLHTETTWQNSDIQKILDQKKRNAFEERHLVRLMFEESYPTLQNWESSGTSSQVVINVEVEEGRQYYAGGIYFLNNEVLSSQLLNAYMQLDSGDVFDFRKYEASKRNLMDAYREDGYLFANFDEKRTFVDSAIHLTFDLIEGLPAQVRKVHIAGNTRTKDKVIRREIKLFPGDTYRQSLLERSFRDVFQLNYFDNLVPDIMPVEGSDQDVDIAFVVQEREAGTGTFSAGMAYSAADGLVGTLGLSIPNCCMGDGQRADLNVEYGAEKKNLTMGFTEPWLWDRPITVGGALNYTWYKGILYDYDIVRYGGQVFAGKRLQWPDDYFYAQTHYSIQRNKQGPNVENSLILNSGWESTVGITIIRDDKNLPIFPTDGSRFVTSVAYTGLGGDFKFIRTDFSFKWWFPIMDVNDETLSLSLANEYGFITGDALQYHSLYQMGGALGYQGLMRGYSSGSIGYRRLGRSYQFFSAELVYPLAPNRFYLLPFFFDAGNVFGKRYDPEELVSKNQPSPLSEWDPSSLKKDVGFGFRVIVPMLGIIGFDFAWPLDRGESYSGFDNPGIGGMEFNFLIGQGF
ncbi:MAG: BamA/TamA family outer membrane protein [Fibrobacter sp.]|nr:BamA/TamA family outer membrane protein [Fibrobacter sp.]